MQSFSLRRKTPQKYSNYRMEKFCFVDSTLKEVNSMAKLFCTVQSERTQKHQTANKELEIKIYYGSREDSKLLAALYVFPTEDVPKFFMKSTVDPTPVTFKPSKKAAEATSDKEDNPTFNRLFPRKTPFFSWNTFAETCRLIVIAHSVFGLIPSFLSSIINSTCISLVL